MMEKLTSVRYSESTGNNKMDILNKSSHVSSKVTTDYKYKHKIVWIKVIFFLCLHLLALWGFCIAITGSAHVKTTLWAIFLMFLSGEGITIGAHRLYAHRSFTATPVLRAILICLQTLAGQNSMYVWCRDHRLHHRYSDTDADPHNAKRGFFFSHVGWLMSRKHPYVIELGKKIDMSDLEADWMVMFQRKYHLSYYIIIIWSTAGHTALVMYSTKKVTTALTLLLLYSLYFLQLYVPIAIVLPVWVPIHYFGESFRNSLLICYFLRYILILNFTWLVNSVAHLYGTRPYDKNRNPVESWCVSFLSLGEGWHNYHHTFPWDYKAAELTMHFNISATIIRMLEKLGLAYNLKSASPEIVSKRIIRTGDGTHYALGNEEAKSIVKAIGPLHPMNPTYNSIHTPETHLTERDCSTVLNVVSDVINLNTNTA